MAILALALACTARADSKKDVGGGWTFQTDLRTQTWLTKEDESLSSWQDVKCWELHGNGVVLNGIDVYQEPGSNLDNFIARLRAHCVFIVFSSNFGLDSQGNAIKHLVFSGNYREGERTTGVWTGDHMPIGFRIRSDPAVDYVKALSMYGVLPQANGMLGSYSDPFESQEEWYAYRTGPRDALKCPDQMVMIGMGVRYDTRKGKIRQLRIHCRTFRKE